MPRFLADVRMTAIHAAAVVSDTGKVLDAAALLDTLTGGNDRDAGLTPISYFN